MKIYTRQGDDGTTSLAGGRRVSKAHLRVEAYGTVDELNCHVGHAAADGPRDSMQDVLVGLQQRLFVLGGELATADGGRPAGGTILEQDVAVLESHIDRWTAELPPLRRFVLPGGSSLACRLHLARAVCRRAERCCVTLGTEETVNPALMRYLNRLSDLLFVMARRANQLASVADVQWGGEGG